MQSFLKKMGKIADTLIIRCKKGLENRKSNQNSPL